MAKITHPYAAIEHRVIDSPAYADLSHSACRLLTLMARQITVNSTWPNGNNGHLHAAFTWCRRYGFGSEHTLRNAIAELISHGFIYRTKSHGANQVCARYAVTWLSIKDRKDLFLDGFVACAWRNWTPTDKKSTRQKVLEQAGKNCSFTPKLPAENAGSTAAESADNELVTNTHSGAVQKGTQGDSETIAKTHRKGRAQEKAPQVIEQLAAGIPKQLIAANLDMGIASVYRIAAANRARAQA